MHHYANLYRQSLLKDVIPFWEKYSLDQESGGYFTCLNAEGNCFDTDKFVWLQARQAWTFSMLYNTLEPKANWLEIAKLGSEFLKKNGSDTAGHYYFSLTREGKPLIAPYNVFSDCFVAMAYAAYAKASGEDAYKQEALKVFENILQRSKNPKGKYNKAITATRPLQNFALPMILCNLSLELEHVLSASQLEKMIDDCLRIILDSFLDKEQGILYENILADGSKSDSFDGRLINPGHGLEACWFIMDIAQRRQDTDLIQQMVDLTLSLLAYGWDEEYGGIFYFLDAKGHPPQQLEWDQKLWWVHLEALVALAKGYQLTKSEKCAQWFEKLHDYTWGHFRDARGGLEWYGYLNRQGKVFLDLKGGKWKGCFHVPRALFQCATVLSKS